MTASILLSLRERVGAAMPTNDSVLLVEDDGDTREMMAVWLRGEGYRVQEACDGQEALAEHDHPLAEGQRLIEGPAHDGTLSVVLEGTPLPTAITEIAARIDRTIVVEGKSVDLGGRRIVENKTRHRNRNKRPHETNLTDRRNECH